MRPLRNAMRRDFGSRQPWRVAITIPARDEGTRIEACLTAAARSLGNRGGIVVAENGSADDTHDRAAAWFRKSGVPGILLQVPDCPGVSMARRAAIAACLDRLAPSAAIMTTDADSRVFPDWVAANLRELAKADLICGTILPEPGEFIRLPPAVAECGRVESAYTALTIAARKILDPLQHDPDPAHLSEPGASLAFRMALYDDVDGIPALATAEDRAFACRAAARGWRVRHSGLARVHTSCRLDGRAPGGMAGTLSARLTDNDPFVDEALEPAKETIDRATTLGRLRPLLAAAGETSHPALLAQLGTLSAFPGSRMRLSDVRRELPLLQAAVARLHMTSERCLA